MIDPAYYTSSMPTGKRRRRARQSTIWVAAADLPQKLKPVRLRLG